MVMSRGKGPAEHWHEGTRTMLVLTRKLGEMIEIGDNIKLKLVRIDGKQVRIGIEAPRSVAVVREELAGDSHRLPAPRESR
ncbi:MAG TPA: carbon storage regulator [Pirellulales bacterium]